MDIFKLGSLDVRFNVELCGKKFNSFFNGFRVTDGFLYDFLLLDFFPEEIGFSFYNR